MERICHVITAECEVSVEQDDGVVRIRITEKDPDLANPTSFEIEGDIEHITEALSTAAYVCANLLDGKEPN